jgi:predicted nucleic acid-binding protein
MRRSTSRPSRPRRGDAVRHVGAGSTAGASAIRYLESSAVLAALLEQDAGALRALRAEGRRVTSALTFAETARALVRARVTGRLTPEHEQAARRALDTLERRCTVVAVSDEILGRVGRPYPVEPIRTLDAIHLATVEVLALVPRSLTMVTRDTRIRENATALGYTVDDGDQA